MTVRDTPVGPRYWIGVASRDHVHRGIAGGFCQLDHGKAAPVRRLSPSDGIVYYSPRTALDGGEPVQAFTGIGHVAPGEPYMGNMGGGFLPTRRDVAWAKDARDAPIRPLLDRLSFTRGRSNWGIVMRRGLFSIDAQDFAIIAAAMGVEL